MSKKKTKAKKQRLKKDKSAKLKMSKVAKDERTRKIMGIFFILISVFLLIAYVSYLFTWKADQKWVRDGGFWHFMFQKDAAVDNLLGKLGAYFSHMSFFNGVGVASFLLCHLFGAIGANLVTDKRVFKIWRNVRHVIFGLIYISTAFSLTLAIFGLSPEFPWGGALGDFVGHWMMTILGKIGAGLLWLVLGLAYAIWRFNIDIVPKNKPHLPSLKDVREKMKIPEDKPNDKDQEVITQALGREEDRRKKELEMKLVHKEPEEKKASVYLERPKQKEPDSEDRSGSQKELKLEIKAVSEEEEKKGIKEKAANLVKKFGQYEPTLDLQNYKYPPVSLLENHGGEGIIHDPQELENNKQQIVDTLENYKIQIDKISATVGPTVTLYEIVPAKGIRISKIRNLEDDIALSLAALGIRIIAPIPGRGTIGIEVPNVKRSVVAMKTLITSDKFQSTGMALPIAIGKQIDNKNFIVDLTTMPHLLIAGATGQGKSVGINSILISLLYKKHPSQLKFILVDPKKVELSIYRKIKNHFLAKLPGEEEAIITDTKKVVYTLNALGIEMDNRYDLLKEAGARNIKEYNKKFINRRLNPENGHRFLPFIVLVIDEFADLIMTAGKEIEMPIARLAQLARAVGIHLIVATQRPSVNILTGTIKANFPARIAFKVSSKVDSRTILDSGGADQLIGKGDMLISYNGKITRLQCAFVDTPEVDNIVDFISEQQGYAHPFLLPEYEGDDGNDAIGLGSGERDELFEDAARVIVETQQGSTSMLQRRMRLGYNRAGRIMDQLEANGIVGPNAGSKARDVLIKTEAELNELLKEIL